MDLRPGLDLLKPYSTDETKAQVRLDSNESPFNLASEVQAELMQLLARLDYNRYPDTGVRSLKAKIANVEGVSPSGVTLGNGSSELLAAICQAFGGKGRSIVYPSPSFSMYPVYVQLADSNAVPVQLNADCTMPGIKMLAEAERTGAKLIILCNPNNPTGTATGMQEIEAVAAGADCPVVVDEAYYEFFGHSAAGLLKKYPNLIIVRTFSKAYGLAAARMGYMLAGDQITAAVGKVLLPYHLNTLSLAAAEAVYNCREVMQARVKEIIAERTRLMKELAALEGVTVYPSAANFILIRSERANDIKTCLESYGIGVRSFSSPELAASLRITVGSKTENDMLMKALRSSIAHEKG